VASGEKMSDEIKTQSNPIGKVVEDSGIENFIRVMAAKWDASRTAARWWEVWKRVPITAATNFLLDALDQLIAYVDQKITDNVDKKATVMDAISRLYDLIIGETLPIWLKPFGTSHEEDRDGPMSFHRLSTGSSAKYRARLVPASGPGSVVWRPWRPSTLKSVVHERLGRW
jgi:hypothetical protein